MNFILNEFELKKLGVSEEQIETLKEKEGLISFFSFGPCEVKNVMETNFNMSHEEANEAYQKIRKKTEIMNIEVNDSTWEMIDSQIACELDYNKTFSKYVEELEELKELF